MAEPNLDSLATELAGHWTALVRTMGSRKLSASLHPALAAKLSPASLHALHVLADDAAPRISAGRDACDSSRILGRVTLHLKPKVLAQMNKIERIFRHSERRLYRTRIGDSEGCGRR